MEDIEETHRCYYRAKCTGCEGKVLVVDNKDFQCSNDNPTTFETCRAPHQKPSYLLGPATPDKGPVRNLIGEQRQRRQASPGNSRAAAAKDVPLCKMMGLGLNCNHQVRVTQGQLHQDTIDHFRECHQVLEHVVDLGGVLLDLENFSTCSASTVWNPVLLSYSPSPKIEPSWFVMRIAVDREDPSVLALTCIQLSGTRMKTHGNLSEAYFSVCGMTKTTHLVWGVDPVECFNNDCDDDDELLLLHHKPPVRMPMAELEQICANWNVGEITIRLDFTSLSNTQLSPARIKVKQVPSPAEAAAAPEPEGSQCSASLETPFHQGFFSEVLHECSSKLDQLCIEKAVPTAGVRRRTIAKRRRSRIIKERRSLWCRNWLHRCAFDKEVQRKLNQDDDESLDDHVME